MWKAILLCALVGLSAAHKASYENYKVFRIVPVTQKQVEFLRQLENLTDGFSFWQSATYAGRNVDIMVAPHKMPEFHEMMKQATMPYNVKIENVQELLDRSSPQIRSGSFDFTSYHTLDEIYENLDNMVKQYPDKVQTIVGGSTYEGRQIKGVKVSFKPNNPGVFIEGGIHAREWITPATTMYIFHQLMTSKDADIRNIAENYDWYIFPSFNPDGYVYTHTTDRMWRKTRKPYGICYGSDPNRNWNYKWNTGGASSNPCTETYAGSAPFSDIETKSMSDYIESMKGNFSVYLSIHSYSQLLMFPYGHTRDHLENYDELYAVGTKMINAIRQRYGTRYITGNIAETIYIATGSTIDYIKGTYGKRYVYTYELRDQGIYGFLLPPEQIIPTGEETMDSVVALMKEVEARGTLNKDRIWTKTCKLYNDYIGSNPNRNWGYDWSGKCYDVSDEYKLFIANYCVLAMSYTRTLYNEANTFTGPESFSEIETKSISNISSEYIETINDKFFAYFSFHSQSPDVTYPSDDITNNTEQYDLDMMNIGGKSFNVPYLMAGSSWRWIRSKVCKNVVETSDLDRGSSIKYIKGTYNTPLVLAYGLQDKFSPDGFLQSPALIVWFGEEVSMV